MGQHFTNGDNQGPRKLVTPRTGRASTVFPLLLRLVAACTLAPAAHAQNGSYNPLSFIHEVRGGILAHDPPFLGKGREEGANANIEIAFSPDLTKLRPLSGIPGRIEPLVGVSGRPSGDSTDQVYAGLGWNMLEHGPAIFRLSTGFALHNGKRKSRDDDRLSLGQRDLFYGSVDVGYSLNRRWSLTLFYQHSSNGFLDGPNQGIDNIGLRIGYSPQR